MQTTHVQWRSFKYPAGEIGVEIIKSGDYNIVDKLVANSDDIIELLLVSDALKRRGRKINRLTIPFIPYTRQDRVCNLNEPLSAKVMADLINMIGADEVVTADTHSDVIGALVNNIIIRPQHHLVPTEILDGKLLICPDAGAEKKILKFKRPYIMCTKVRDTQTGKITRTVVHADDLTGKDCIIVDDICDGGRTFIEIAKELEAKGARSVELYVTHGLFTKGLDVFKGYIDRVHHLDYQTFDIITKEIEHAD